MEHGIHNGRNRPAGLARSLAALDLTIGTAVAGAHRLARGAEAVTRLAGPPVRAAAGGGRAGLRLPAESAGRLRSAGASLRTEACAAAVRRLQALVPSAVDALLDRVDVTDLLVRRVDLIGLAQYVVDGIDLPAIIRESTSSVASEGVRGVRMQGIAADEAVATVVDRMLLRRRPRHTSADRADDGSDGESIVDGPEE